MHFIITNNSTRANPTCMTGRSVDWSDMRPQLGLVRESVSIERK